MNAVIKAENLGKKYIIGHQKQRGGATLRDTMTHTARGIWQRMRHPLSPNRESIDLEELWALKDVNFEVQQGERVGIIGRNGAGKSTLLKVLSRITEPTTGKVRIKGRVSSLLEVGTGFHPELTGRENIFLNGAILGMTQQETKQKFDEIVAFSELEKFLDTPVKRYSSGMYVRLAFAVAAHLEPEILIVDEVLAVGDVAFRKKCLGKMETVAGEGRTVLFVSHNMEALKQLCSRTVLLQDGQVVADGSSHEVVQQYLGTSIETAGERVWPDPTKAPGDDVVRLRAVRVVAIDGEVTATIRTDQAFGIQVEFETLIDRAILNVGIGVRDEEGTVLFSSIDFNEPQWGSKPKRKGKYTSTCYIPGNLLNSGRLSVDVSLKRYSPSLLHAREEGAILLEVREVDTQLLQRYPGVIRPSLEWKGRFRQTALEKQ